MQISTIGIDFAKRVFQIHGVDRDGNIVLRRQLRRAQVLSFFAKLPPCLVGMEACGTSHHWARELTALGHEVRLMPPQYVKPYVKRNKHDPADPEACCEAVGRPSMRFVPVAGPHRVVRGGCECVTGLDAMAGGAGRRGTAIPRASAGTSTSGAGAR